MSATSNYKIWVEGKLRTDTLQKQLNDFQKKIKDIKIKVNVTGNTQLKDANTQLKDMPTNTETAQRGVYKLATEFNNLKSTVLGLYSTLKGLTQPVFELDASLTEFKKVSDLSGDSLDAYVDKLKGLRTEVGRSTAEMVDAATEFKKSGYSEDDSAELAQIAAMYQNIADEEVSTGDAANFIIAQMKAFGIEAENSMHIIDAVNEVSNNYAVSSADLATNIGKVSSVMATTNTTYEETLGMMTGITEITRNAGKAANGLKTLATNFIKIVDPASSDGVQMLAVLDKLGISAYDADGQLRPMYDTLKDLDGVWSALDTNSQDYIASLFAGANQMQTFTALMSNFDTAISATNTAMDSQGSAAEENAEAMESLQKSVDNLKAAWADLINNLIESGAIKELIDKVTAFVTSLSEKDAHEMIANLETIIGLFVAFKGLGILGNLSTATKGFTDLAGALKLFSSVQNAVTGIETLSTALEGLASFLVGGGGATLGGVAAGIGTLAVLGATLYAMFEQAVPSIGTVDKQIEDIEGKIDRIKETLPDITDPAEIYHTTQALEGYNKQLEELEQARKDAIFGKDNPSLFEALLGGSSGELGDAITEYKTFLELKDEIGLDPEVLENLDKAKEKVQSLVNEGLTYLANGEALSQEQADKLSEALKIVGGNVDLLGEQLASNVNEGKISVQTAIQTISNSKLDLSQQESALNALTTSCQNVSREAYIAARQLLAMNSMSARIDSMTVTDFYKTGAQQSGQTFAQWKANALKTEKRLLDSYIRSDAWGLEYDALTYTPKSKGTNDGDDGTKTGKVTIIDGTGTGGTTAGASSKTIDSIKEENDVYKENIAILEHRIEMMKRNGATEEELIAEYEKMKNIVHEQAEKYRAMGLDENSEYIRDLQNQWWGYVDDIQDLYDEMDKKRKEALEKQRDETQEYLDALQVYADERAEELEKQKAAQDKVFDERIKQLRAEKDALDEQNEAIEEQNKLKELQQKLDSAKEKRIQVYHEGVGFTWDEDTEAIQEAQSDLEEEQRQQALKQQKAAIDEKISLIEQEKEDVDDYYDEQIDAWRNFSTEYSNIESRVKARQILAKNKEKQNLDERLGNFESFKDDYVRAANELIQINNSLGESNINPSDVISSLIQAGVITGDWFKNATKSTETHASGTVRFKGGLTSINENGAEMLIPPSLNTLANLPTGTGIIPHNITQNLMELGKYSLNGLKRLLGGGTSYNFSGTTFSFPNMTNNSSINQFIKDLSNFENSAIQSSYSRI